MIERRRFLAIGTAALSAIALTGSTDQPPKLRRIGLLGATPRGAAGEHLWEAFVQAMRELGYVHGQNLVIEERYSEGRDDRLPALAVELVRLNVEVIVAGATRPVHAAREATASTPIVMANHSDPVGSRLVATLSRPGGNVTGLSIINPDLTGKRLELLKQTIPSASRVAVLSNPTSEVHGRMLAEASTPGAALGLKLHRVAARGDRDYESAFATMLHHRADAVLVLGDLTFWRDRRRLAELTTKHRLPAMFAQREHVEAGGLVSYGPDLRDNYQRAALYVDKILRGAKPADLPVEQPTKFELVVNMKTARTLGLTIPPSLLMRADQVIE